MSFLRRLFGFALPDRSTLVSQPDVSARGSIEGSFRKWAASRRMRVDEASAPSLRVIGRIAGRDVVVDPGIDGAHPGWVQVTVAVALPSVSATLVTRATPPSGFAIARIRALFDDRDIGPELRAISVSTQHLRLRLAPGAAPRVVEHAVRAVGEVMRAIHVAPESEPRHSCTTTVPYPS